jgi:hypothetical protein
LLNIFQITSSTQFRTVENRGSRCYYHGAGHSWIRSRAGSVLKSNNHFVVRATGPAIGFFMMMMLGECFRSYTCVADSTGPFDFSSQANGNTLLTSQRRLPGVGVWIKTTGYATNPKYPSNTFKNYSG